MIEVDPSIGNVVSGQWTSLWFEGSWDHVSFVQYNATLRIIEAQKEHPELFPEKGRGEPTEGGGVVASSERSEETEA